MDIDAGDQGGVQGGDRLEEGLLAIKDRGGLNRGWVQEPVLVVATGQTYDLAVIEDFWLSAVLEILTRNGLGKRYSFLNQSLRQA